MQPQKQRAVPSISVVTTHQPARAAKPKATTLLAARAILDKSPGHVVILDEEGTIIDVNGHWRDFGARNGGEPDKIGIGVNYLKSCLEAAARHDEQASRFAQGLCAVMDGECDVFELDSLCQVAGEMHVFRGRVERLIAPSRAYYLVSHEDLNVGQQRTSA